MAWQGEAGSGDAGRGGARLGRGLWSSIAGISLMRNSKVGRGEARRGRAWLVEARRGWARLGISKVRRIL